MSKKHSEELPVNARQIYENTRRSSLRELGRDEGTASRDGWAAVQKFYEESRESHWIHR